jgi:protein CpxP
MTSNLKISLIAGLLLAAGVAHAQPPMAGGMGGMGGMGGAQCDMMGGMQGPGMHHRGMGQMDPAKMQTMVDRRHAALKTQLKLTAEQEPAWTAFMASHQPPAGMKDKPSAMADLAKLSTPERIDKMKELRAQHMSDMTAAMDKQGAATKAFYAALTPEQQKTFDAVPKMGRGQGKDRPAGMAPMQPK